MIQISEHSTMQALEEYMSSMAWLQEEERLKSSAKAGDGNMNVVLRITSNLRSFILKQSRPFVQKYQDIPAPLERILVEKVFYETIANGPIKQHIPSILGYDPKSYILALEDLGHCDDMSFIYKQRKISDQHVHTLLSISHHIHSTEPPNNFPDNMKMRALNHQHIFVLPFLMDNGFSLDDIQPGLQQLSMTYKEDQNLKDQIGEIGKKYLSEGKTLLHGDYYPGSWMATGDNLYVIDPEFGFLGFAEFDLGVMTAHLILATHDLSYIEKITSKYPNPLDTKLLKKVAGIEIMRRLIGLAQLPLTRTLEEKQLLLEMSKKMILS